jgi:ABC-type transport system involved in multi-copper enzyme maturation permease subunit
MFPRPTRAKTSNIARVQRIYAIALTSFREAIRDRILFAVLGLGAASVCLGLGMGALSYGEVTRIVVDHGLVTVSLLANVVAIFLGATFLYKELELRTLYVLLARPVARHEIVLGKFVGILVTAAVFIAVTASVLLALVTMTAAEETVAGVQRSQYALGLLMGVLHTRGSRLALLASALALGGVGLLVPRVRRALSVGAVLPISLAVFTAFALVARLVAPIETAYVVYGCALVLFEVAITASIAMLFSSFSTPFVTAMMSAGAFAIFRSTWMMQHVRGRFPAALRAMLEGIAQVVPNLHLFVPARPVLLPDDPARSALAYVLSSGAYATLYAAVLLAAASLLFRRRDLV